MNKPSYYKSIHCKVASHFTAMQESEELSLPKQTTYWYAHRETAYLVYLRDFLLRIDPSQPGNELLKQSLEKYIKEADQLEESLLSIEIGKKGMSKEEVEEYEKKIADIEKQMEETTAKLLKLRIEGVSLIFESKTIEKTLLRYTESIYNARVNHFNTIIANSKAISFSRSKTLKKYELAEFSLLDFNGILDHNSSIIVRTIEELEAKRLQLVKDKQNLSQEITNFFENRTKRLFNAANERFHFREVSLQTINQLEEEIQVLNHDTKELEMIQNRKIANIALYAQGIDMKSKEDLEATLSTSSQSSQKSQLNESLDYEPPSNPSKRVFTQEKKSWYIWPLLALWFIGLLFAVIRLVY